MRRMLIANNQHFVAVIIHALIRQSVSMVLKCTMNPVTLGLNVPLVVVLTGSAPTLCSVMKDARLIGIVCLEEDVAVKVTVLIKLSVMEIKGFGIIVTLIPNV